MKQAIEEWWFLIWITFVATMILSAVIYRRWLGLNFFRPKFANPLFEETWQSGRSLRNIFSRFGGANSCLWIVVANGTLHIGPHFPFNVFVTGFYGLEQKIPVDKIIAVEKINRLFRKPAVRIDFRQDLIGEEAFEIVCNQSDKLVTVLNEIRSKS